MIVSAHQPAYLPWCGLFAKVRDSDVFVILDTVPRSHGDFTNRNRIKTQNGVQWLTVPVLGPKQQMLREVRVDTAKQWKRKHWRALELAYAKAPFWDYYRDTITSLLTASWPRLVDVDDYLFRWMLGEFGIDTKVIKASQLSGVNGAKNDMIVSICQALQADEYLAGTLGRSYYEPGVYLKAGVKVYFQEYETLPYRQLHGPFVPRLSALDMLLNVGPDKARELL